MFPRRHLLGVLVAAFACTPAVSSSQEQDWTEIPAGQRALQSERVHSDMVLRFQFQLADPDTDGVVFVRMRPRGPLDQTDAGYRVHLTTRATGADAFGAISGLNRTVLVERMSGPSPTPRAGEWHDCEIRAVRQTLQLSIDGRAIATASGLEGWVGYFGFESNRGRLRVRRLEAEPSPLSRDPFGSGAVTLGSGIQDPRVLKEVRPAYFASAFNSGVQGEVLMEAVVEADGTVGDVRIRKALHPDLDEAALAAARQWQFAPASQAGKPIAVVVTLALSFRIKN